MIKARLQLRKMHLLSPLLVCVLLSHASCESSSILVNADPNSRPELADQVIYSSESVAKRHHIDNNNNHDQAVKTQEQANLQIVHQAPGKEQESRPLSATKFDPSSFKSVYAAIRNHPNLRTFGALCELDGVREFVGLDKSELTVFAPIDRSLGDIFALAKQRSISLSELAKHHIAPALIVADESTQLPLKFHSLQQASPLYLAQSDGEDQQQQQQFVNNAKILATYTFRIEEGDLKDSHQALHLIDAPLEFAYALKKSQVRQHDGRTRTSIQRNALNLDDLGLGAQEQLAALDDFERRFSEPLAATSTSGANDELSLFATRPDKSGLELSVSRFLVGARQFAARLRNRLYATNETSPAAGPTSVLASNRPSSGPRSQLNTYFLPLSSDQLDALLAGELKTRELFYEAHILPDQVLFTRQLGLGRPHASLFNKFARNSRLELNLAKTSSSNQLDSKQQPLLLQSKCSASKKQPAYEPTTQQECQFGVVSSEIVLANVPLENGVLHLLRRPIMVADSSLINLLNDNANQLTEITHSIGSRTHQQEQQNQRQVAPKLNKFRELISKHFALLSTINSNSNVTIFAPSDEAFEGLRYDLRALIAGDDSLVPVHWDSAYRAQLLEKLLRRHLVVGSSVVASALASTPEATLIVTNEAGSQVRVKQSQQNQDHDDASAHAQPLTIELINGEQQHQQYKPTPANEDSTSVKARLIEADLIGKNGVLHIIDSVLGEPLETLESLLRSLELRQETDLLSSSQSHSQNPIGELTELVRAQLAIHHQASSSSDLINSVESLSNKQNNIDRNNNINSQQPKLPSENEIIAKTISQFLDDIEQQQQQPPNQAKYQLLASSVNLTLQLARLSGFGCDQSTLSQVSDYAISSAASTESNNNEQQQLCWFKDTQRQLTLFAPSDLAWLRFMQAQPEIYKPIFNELLATQTSPDMESGANLKSLHQPATSQGNDFGAAAGSSASLASSTAAALPAMSRHLRALASQSSQRIKQILERHLVPNARLPVESLNRLERVQTMRATLRLQDQQQGELNTQLQSSANLQQQQHQSSPMSAFAALHSIVTGASPLSSSSPTWMMQLANVKQIRKTISFDSMTGTQFNPCCNYATSNGNLYIVDRVFALPDDALYIQQTGSAPSASSSMSSLLGGDNSFLLELIQALIGHSAGQLAPRNGALILLGTLLCGIILLSLLATVLLIRRRRQHNKLAGHRQLESGLTSSSSANSTSGSTSTTKSL